MSDFEDWLARAARRRDAVGLTRRTLTRPARETDRRVLDLAGNDYLGLADHPRVIAGAIEATELYGTGATASRLVTGTLPIHEQLEAALTQCTGAESALVFSTGYQANLGVVTALSGPDVLLVSDAHVHASLVDACRLARGTVQVVPHNDFDAVDAALAQRSQPRALVLVETIYSVLGDAAPLASLAEICHRHRAVLIADEAHALGVAGPRGAGLLAAEGLLGDSDVIATVTLSKALGAQGGAVLGSRLVREHLVNRARPFIYDTGLAPAATGAALAALDVISTDPARPARALTAAARLAEACGVPRPAGAVLSVPMPGPREALAAVAQAAEDGVRIGCFRPPSTPDQISRLRITAHAQHTDDELARAVDVLERVCGP